MNPGRSANREAMRELRRLVRTFFATPQLAPDVPDDEYDTLADAAFSELVQSEDPAAAVTTLAIRYERDWERQLSLQDQLELQAELSDWWRSIPRG